MNKVEYKWRMYTMPFAVAGGKPVADILFCKLKGRIQVKGLNDEGILEIYGIISFPKFEKNNHTDVFHLL